MAIQLFTSNRNGVRQHDNNVDDHFLSLSTPSLGLNHVISINPTIETRSQPTPIFGQLGLSHRVTEMRRTVYSQNKVRVESVTEYVPLETPPALCLGNINGTPLNATEIIRTQFLSGVSTRERISIPNNCVCCCHNQFLSRNMNPTNTFTGSEFSDEMFYQTPSRNQPALVKNNPDDYEFKGNGVAACSPIRVRFPGSHDQITSHDQLALTLGNLNSTESKSNRVRAHTRVNAGVIPENKPQVDGQNQEVTYGTRSLPYKKYGPYTCPRCYGKFETSQSFASHMGKHYKSESRKERKTRQALKYKKKNLRLVQSPDGLTVVPESFEMMDTVDDHSKKESGKAKLGVETNEKRVVKQEEGSVGMAFKHGAASARVVIKKEPV